jgi:hypothetical protein
MSTTKMSAGAVASTLASIADQITSSVLSRGDRRKVRARNERAPDELLELLCHLAEQNGGQLLGMSFDPVQARATLAETSAARTQIGVTRQLLQRMEDDMIQQRATVADRGFAIFMALRRLVMTTEGNSLSPAYEQMKQIVRDRPRKTRKKAAKAVATKARA